MPELTMPAPWASEIAAGPGPQAPLADPTRAYLASLSPAGREAMMGCDNQQNGKSG